MNVIKTLDSISETLMLSLSYKTQSIEQLDNIIEQAKKLTSSTDYLMESETYLRDKGKSHVLYHLSSILHNLKTKNDLILTQDTIKWLTTVWNNFIRRNRTYQLFFNDINKYRLKLANYFEVNSSFINKLSNVNLIKDDYITTYDIQNSPLTQLEEFVNSAIEIITWMKPTYFFLLDFYYEKRLLTGKDIPEAIELEKNGLAQYGTKGYYYQDLLLLVGQSMAVLEASYLTLKKKKSDRKLITVNGKKKFLTLPEIYQYYLDKFESIKKELASLYVAKQ